MSASDESSPIISADLKVRLPGNIARAFSCTSGDKVKLSVVYGGELQVGCEEATIEQAPDAGFFVVVNSKQREMVQGKLCCGWTEQEDETLLLLVCNVKRSKVSHVQCDTRWAGGDRHVFRA